MPAEYGGRLSSVLDITMKDGNNKKYEVDGGIGLLSSRLTLQGPVQKEKSSFIISGRRTYVDVLSKPFMPEDNAFSGSGYYFYDLTTKINYRISDKDRLYLSGYFGRDVFNFSNSENGIGIEIPWGNATTSLRWNHLFNDKLFMNTSLIFLTIDLNLILLNRNLSLKYSQVLMIGILKLIFYTNQTKDIRLNLVQIIRIMNLHQEMHQEDLVK